MHENEPLDLTRGRSPLQELREAMAAASTPEPMGVRLREIPFRGQINLRGDPRNRTFLTGVKNAVYIEPPTIPNTVVSGSFVSALWLGPDEWLLVSATGTEGDVASRLREKLSGLHSSVVDLTASQTIIELSGASSRHVLMKACSLDLHPRVFLPRQCAQTIFARTTVIIEQVDESPVWRVYVRNSFAQHLAKWLLDAIKQCATDPKYRARSN